MKGKKKTAKKRNGGEIRSRIRRAGKTGYISDQKKSEKGEKRKKGEKKQ